MNNFYKDYYQKYWQHRVKTKNIYTAIPPRIKIAAKSIPGTGGLKIFDIATGEGSCGKHLNSTTNHTIDGLEVSPAAAKLAKKYYHQLTIGSIDDPKIHKKFSKAKSYDIVNALEVIEHLINPDDLFRLADKLIKPAGKLIISTPNTAWWKYRLDLLKGRFIDEAVSFTSLDHLHFFTLNSLKLLAKKNGYQMETVDAVFSLPWYFGRLPQGLQSLIGKTWPEGFGYQLVCTFSKIQNKPKVAHLVDDFINPTESWIYNQIISQKLFQPIVLTRNRKNQAGYPFLNVFEYPKLFDLEICQNRPILKKFLALIQRLIDITDSQINYYLEIIKKTRPKLIHAHFGQTGFNAIKLKDQTNLPLVVSFYGQDIHWLPHANTDWHRKYQQLFKTADAFITRGPTMSKVLKKLGCPTKKIHYIDYGIDTASIKKLNIKPAKKITFFVASRLEPIKGLDYLLVSWSQVEKSHSNVKLIIYGSGSQETELKALSKKLTLKQVKFAGFVPYQQLIKKIKTHHVFIHPSVRINTQIEGNPTSLMERMAAGFPVIATRHADIPLLVKHQKTGLLVPEKDTKALARAINYMVKNQTKWKTFGDNSRDLILKDFQLNKQTRQREKLYSQLIKS